MRSRPAAGHNQVTPMIDTATVSEILAHKGAAVCTISPEATVFEAVRLMTEKNIGSLAVVENGRLAGIVSERDYTRKVTLHGKTSKTTLVREILSDPVITVTPNHTIEACLRLMTEHRFRHLPVLVNGQLAGLVSIGDIVNWIITAQRARIEQLQTYISGVPG